MWSDDFCRFLDVQIRWKSIVISDHDVVIMEIRVMNAIVRIQYGLVVVALGTQKQYPK